MTNQEQTEYERVACDRAADAHDALTRLRDLANANGDDKGVVTITRAMDELQEFVSWLA